jgi:FAD:protein FMN transferase
VTINDQRFRAMGSDAQVIVVGGPERLLETAIDRIEQLEARWSRFRPDSEVCELNRQAGSPVEVSADTLLLVRRAIEAWRITGSSFDPTVLGAVIGAGYDRSFELLGTAPPVTHEALMLGCTDIEVQDSAVRLPAGTGFDAGGIGKGLAADLVVSEAMAAGAEGVCVNLGGDLRVAGIGPDGAWTVGIDHPWSSEPIALLGLTNGAVATSTTLKRTWVTSGVARHHLIDPSTGDPSDSDVNLACVVTGEAWRGEVLAKAVLLRGSQRAFDLLDPCVAQALIVDHNGNITCTSGLTAFLGDSALPSRVTRDHPNVAHTDDRHFSRADDTHGGEEAVR